MRTKQSVKWNLRIWDADHRWSDRGDSWSEPWGGPENQWRGAILPRIQVFLPAHTCLEIAPGHGRWTQFLKDACERLILVDLSGSCIASCQHKFADCSHISYYVNDGKSLAMLPDESIDFAFSFDSLVHVEADVIEAYLQQLAVKLTQQGVGFIHHSNLGQYKNQLWYVDFPLMRNILKLAGLDMYTAYRTFSVSAAKFEEMARAQASNASARNW